MDAPTSSRWYGPSTEYGRTSGTGLGRFTRGFAPTHEPRSRPNGTPPHWSTTDSKERTLTGFERGFGCGLSNGYIFSVLDASRWEGTTVAQERLTQKDFVEPHPWGLAVYWFSLNYQGSALLTIVVPTALAQILHADRTTPLARLVALSAAISMLVPPLLGALSDRRRQHRLVGRRSMVLGGTALNIVGLSWAMRAPSLLALTGGLLLSMFGQSAALTTYQAMLPEVVPPERWGQASARMGVASLGGTVLGLAVAGLLPLRMVYWAMVGASAVGALLTAMSVPELAGPWAVQNPKSEIRHWSRFLWTFAGRFFVLFGQTILMTFVLYFFSQVLGVRNPGAATALIAGLALLGAILSSYYAATTSDHVDRARLVALACLPMAAAVAGFGLFPFPWLVFGLAVVWGIGYGAFLSVDWALALDSIPDLANVARDLGIWGIASNLPAVVAPIVGGILLGHVHPVTAGYRVLFVAAAVAFLLGAVLVEASRIRVSLVTLLRVTVSYVVVGILLGYVTLVCRVRTQGLPPTRRRGLLVLTNHSHDLDGMIILAQLFASAPLTARLRAVTSQRLFEPGFLSTIAPGPVRYLVGGFNVGAVLRYLGAIPMENMPLTRPLASWAYSILQRHGNVFASQVFTEQALQRIPPPRPERLSDLWARGRRPQQGPLFSILSLRTPYREEEHQALRSPITHQMRTIAQAIQAGDTVYLTPEGKMSTTGRLGPFRAVLDTLLQHTQGIALAAIAYDPWTGRRMQVLIHWQSVSPEQDLPSAILAARPVTVSQVLASQLLQHPQGIPETELVEAVRRNADAFATASGSPTHVLVARTLHRMQRGHLVQGKGGLWQALGGRDRHFPLVADALGAQAEQFRATATARRALAESGDQPTDPQPNHSGPEPVVHRGSRVDIDA